MAITKEKVETALKDVKVLCVSKTHEEQNDGWVLEVIGDDRLSLRSLRYEIIINIPYGLLSDRKKPEALKGEIFTLFTFFTKGLEYGVQLARDKMINELQNLYAPVQLEKPQEVEQKQSAQTE